MKRSLIAEKAHAVVALDREQRYGGAQTNHHRDTLVITQCRIDRKHRTT